MGGDPEPEDTEGSTRDEGGEPEDGWVPPGTPADRPSPSSAPADGSADAPPGVPPDPSSDEPAGSAPEPSPAETPSPPAPSAPPPAWPLPAGAPLPPPGASAHPGGRPGQPSVAWIGGATVFVVLLCALVLVVEAATDDSQELQVQGEPIRNASAELAETEEALTVGLDTAVRASREAGDVVAYDDITCWFSYPDGGEEPDDHVRCGPVAFADSQEGTYWLRVPVRYAEADGAMEALIGDLASRRTWAVDGEVLQRPDGRDAPTAGEIDLERPPAPVVPEDAPTVVAVDAGDIMVDLEEPEQGRINGLGYTSEVVGHGTTDRIVVDDGGLAQRGVAAAPDGQTWLLFTLSTAAAQWERMEVSYGIEAGGEVRPLDPRASIATPDGSTVTLAALVAEDADDVALVVEQEGLEQRWSFAAGAPADDVPAILYRESGTRVAEGDEQSVPYTVTGDPTVPPDYVPPSFPEYEPEPLPPVPEYDPEPLPTIPEYEPEPLPTIPEYEPEPLPTVPEYEPEPLPTIPEYEPEPLTDPGESPAVAVATVVDVATGAAPAQTEEQLTVRFDEARLHYGVQVGTDAGEPDLHTAGGPDRALLYLVGLEAEWDSFVAEHALGAESVSLVLEDGTEAEPLPVTVGLYDYLTVRDVDEPLEMPSQVRGFGQVPVWDVPAGTERATLRIAPEPTGDQFVDVDYQGTMEFELAFG